MFLARCPECGSYDTKLDLKATENLKLVPVTALLSAIQPGLGTRVRMRCCVCKHRFLG
jgi:hypothetical protein